MNCNAQSINGIDKNCVLLFLSLVRIQPYAFQYELNADRIISVNLWADEHSIIDIYDELWPRIIDSTLNWLF